MFDETTIKQAAIRHGQTGNLATLYLWFLRRISTTLLAVLLVANLLSIYFFNSDGLAGVDYTMLTTRWLDQQWGVLWRVFDWLLVVLGVLVGVEMLQRPLTSSSSTTTTKRLIRTALTIVWLFIVILAAQIIFGFWGG